MDFSIEADLSTYSADDLAAKITEGEAELDRLFALDNPTEDDVQAATTVADAITALRSEQAGRVTSAADRSARMAALRESTVVATVEEPEPEPEPEPAPEPVVVASEVVPAAVAAAPASSAVATLSRRVARPLMPVTRSAAPISITASADVPGYSAGTVMENWDAVTDGFINKARSFPTVWGVEGAALQRYPVSQFHLDFPQELTASGSGKDVDVLDYASRESRLPSNSLTASGGWCAPSETIYDLCGGGSTDGLWDAPEISVNRGGVRYTSGPDFSALYAATFCQTEAQAIAGTAKTCYEVPCPSFTDVRLDACGICLTSPILTEVGYPELVAAFIREAMIAHQLAVSAKLLTAALAGSTALAFTDRKSTTSNTLDNIEWVANLARATYRVSNSATIEVVLPFWAKGAIRADLSMRTGVDLIGVTDSQIAAYFGARNLSVQFVFAYQPLSSGTTNGYPATMEALIYPAGTFVKGTSPVINLDAVYDSASLKQNLYTALFFEQGVLLLKKCFTSYKATIALCSAGTTGIANNAVCMTAA
jgi:hypothetical protein